MSDRGMKKWAPYASLIEQAACLEKMRYERNKIEKPKIASEEAEFINNILVNYHGQELVIKFFYNGYLYEVKTIIKSINKTKRILVLPNGKLPISEIISIKDESFSNNFDNFLS